MNLPSRPYKVEEITAIIHRIVSSAPELSDIYVEGEISNFKLPSSGHAYFILKDARSSLRCVCFRGQMKNVPFAPANGMVVVAHGSINIYDANGDYQLYVDRLEPSGVGALALAIQQRAQRLSAEGLFDESVKRTLPLFPQKVVVVTSPTGAAVRDVCTVIQRRAPGVSIIISPTMVQGAAAPGDIAQALNRAGHVGGAAVVLLVRGGGSLEDLAAFQEEIVARAIRACPLPVVTGIGHETDTTIADFAADRRAPTPSAAAEIAVPSVLALHQDVNGRTSRLYQALRKIMESHAQALNSLQLRLGHVSPRQLIRIQYQRLDGLILTLRSDIQSYVGRYGRQLDQAVARLGMLSPVQRICRSREEVAYKKKRLDLLTQTYLNTRQSMVVATGGKLDALSPLNTLQRGYSITLDGKTGEVINSVGKVHIDQVIQTRFRDGHTLSTVSTVAGDTD